MCVCVCVCVCLMGQWESFAWGSEDHIRREKMYINVQANRDQNKYGTQEVKGKEDNDRCYKKLS